MMRPVMLEMTLVHFAVVGEFAVSPSKLEDTRSGHYQIRRFHPRAASPALEMPRRLSVLQRSLRNDESAIGDRSDIVSTGFPLTFQPGERRQPVHRTDPRLYFHIVEGRTGSAHSQQGFRRGRSMSVQPAVFDRVRSGLAPSM
jgi:hypothetical protein